MLCGSCGCEIPDGMKLCGHCGAPLTVKAEAAQEAEGSRTTATAPGASLIAGDRIARMGDRLIAVILDTLLLGALFAVFGMWYSVGRGGVTARGFSLTGSSAVIAMAVVALAGLVYYWLAEAGFGATLGKAIAGVRVVSSDGSRCGLRASLIRNLLRVVDGIAVYLVGFLVAIVSKRRQRVGDRVAGTVVTEHSPHNFIRGIAVVLWVALLAGGVVEAYLIHQHAPAATVPEQTPSPALSQAAPAESAPIEAASSAGPPAGTEFRPSVQSTGDLKITHFDFLVKENGTSRPYAPYHRGDVVSIEYKIGGFARDSDSRMRLNLKAMATDPHGELLYPVWAKRLNQNSDGSPASGSYSAQIQAFAVRGDYQIRIEADDEVSGAHLKMTVPFVVQGPPIKPADEFEVRDFALAVSEGGEPAEPVVLEGEGTVYMRCNLFGIHFQKEHVDVQMALTVRGPGGKVLLDNPRYFHNTDEFTYHPATFFLPITGHLNVPGGMAKGTYNLEYLAKDNIGGSQIRRTATLEVR